MSNIEKLLNTPLEYLLTIDTKENLENIKDENGLTVMHWAIVNHLGLKSEASWLGLSIKVI